MFFSSFFERSRFSAFAIIGCWRATNDLDSDREPPFRYRSKFRGKSADKIDKLSRIYRPALNVGSGLINAVARID